MKDQIDRINDAFIAADYLKTESLCHDFLKKHDHVYVTYMLSMSGLHNGDLVGGMTAYKARWSSPEMSSLWQQLHKYGRYRDSWDAIRNQKMIITGEQGFGDELLFSRVLTPLVETCKKLLIVCSKGVQALLQHNFPTVEFIGMGEPLDHRKHEFDGIATFADMFRAFVIEHGKAPEVPIYLPSRHLQPKKTETSKPTIALVHQAGKIGDNSKDRSIASEKFRPLIAQYDIFSFQVPHDHLDFARVSLGSKLHTFLDTANYLSGMDLAVSCDTAFAHLALNTGKPTVLVYNEYIDWRWKNNLYPAVKIVQQENILTQTNNVDYKRLTHPARDSH
jgi:hypothetical protein